MKTVTMRVGFKSFFYCFSLKNIKMFIFALASFALIVLAASGAGAQLVADDDSLQASNDNSSTLQLESCLTNDNDTLLLCRNNADCCSGLCTTFNFPTPKCVVNNADNHISDAFAARVTRDDFVPKKYDGMLRWKDKVAVVTGAASGIGFALTKRLCNEGMIVVGTDINSLGVKKTAEHCPANTYYPFPADLRSERAIKKLFHFINETLGRVDVLINNAGVTRVTPLYNVSSEGLRTTMHVNLLAPILCTREALRIMFEKNITSGYIMFTNSIHGDMIQEVRSAEQVENGYYVYEAAKHALKLVREGLRRELRAKGSRIRVGEVAPASVITNIYDSLIPHDMNDHEKVKSIFSGATGVNKIDRLSPDDVAEAFVYMLQAPERMDINTILLQNNNLPKSD